MVLHKGHLLEGRGRGREGVVERGGLGKVNGWRGEGREGKGCNGRVRSGRGGKGGEGVGCEGREGKGVGEEGRSVKVTISILIVTWRVVSCIQKDAEHHQCRVKWYMNSPCNFVRRLRP